MARQMTHQHGGLIDNPMAGVRIKLESLLETLEQPFQMGEVVAMLREMAESCDGEMLFDLPAEQGDDTLNHWAVLRFAQGGEDLFIHVFLDGDGMGYSLAADEDVASRFSSFARTWVDVLTKWAAGSAPSLPAPGPATAVMESAHGRN